MQTTLSQLYFDMKIGHLLAVLARHTQANTDPGHLPSRQMGLDSHFCLPCQLNFDILILIE